MTPPSDRRLARLGFGVALLLMAVFGALVFQYGRELRGEIRAKMIERDAAVLYPIAQQQIDAGAPAPGSPDPSASRLALLLPDARREGLLAMAIFDEDGVTLEQVPSNQLLVELPVEDFFRLLDGRPITRFFPEFSLARIFPGIPPGPPAPVLEIILPLHRRDPSSPSADEPPPLVGFVRYHLDARALHRELTTLDRSVFRKTLFALALGVFSIGAIVAAAFFGLRRAQRLIAQRNEQLIRANFELSLAAKASALGQITSHLIHGLQGPVAGLRAMVANRAPTEAGAADWSTAADYTERMQSMIQEAVALLGDTTTHAAYELSGYELADTIRKRNAPLARQKDLSLAVSGGFDAGIDNHRGGILCLITSNLIQNAIEATDSGRTVAVILRRVGDTVSVAVSDEGSGIPEELRGHLFEPGRTGRPNGSGLGLAISQLLARQIGATLTLESTGATGTVFRLVLPLATPEP